MLANNISSGLGLGIGLGFLLCFSSGSWGMSEGNVTVYGETIALHPTTHTHNTTTVRKQPIDRSMAKQLLQFTPVVVQEVPVDFRVRQSHCLLVRARRRRRVSPKPISRDSSRVAR